MTKYIDKSTLVAEIEKRIKETETMQPKFDQFWAGQISAFKGILKILDTLEVKEVKDVDLEKEYKDFVEEDPVYNKLVNGIVGKAIAKHFFELGLTASNKAQNIWHDASEKLPTGVIVVNNGGNLHIGWSTDEGDGIEDEHGNLITKTYQKWAREKDLT